MSLCEDQLNRWAPKRYERIYFTANVLGLGFIVYAMLIVTRDMYEFDESTLVMDYPLVYLGVFILFLLALAVTQLRYLAAHGPQGHDSED